MSVRISGYFLPDLDNLLLKTSIKMPIAATPAPIIYPSIPVPLDESKYIDASDIKAIGTEAVVSKMPNIIIMKLLLLNRAKPITNSITPMITQTNKSNK